MKLKNKLVYALIVPLMGCATVKESLLLGAVTGAATGAVVSNSDNRDSSKPSTGALAGAVIGLAASYLIHDGLEKRDSRIRRETLLNLDNFNVSRPISSESNGEYYVTTPKIETQCFDSNVRGNKLIEAHCESVIVDRSEWTRRQTGAQSGRHQ